MSRHNHIFSHYPISEPYECFRLKDWGEIRIYILEEKLVRVLFLPQGKLSVNRSWMLCPDRELPWEGRDRFDVSGFSLPDYRCESSLNHTLLETAALRLRIDHEGFRIQWYARYEDEWVLFARDRNTQSYNFGQWGEGIYHYLQREVNEQYFGLGEKCGNMDRAGRRFRMKNIDAMGYNAETTDPLYKHVPFYINRDREKHLAFGIFYDNPATCDFDMGQELDNYHDLYRYYQAQQGDLDYYMLLGPTVQEVVQQFSRLSGPTIFGPKWSLGYSGSTMSYTDAPNAQELLEQFIQDCETHAIPCDSFQLSSGYTSIAGKRYVFNWNRDKIPEPQALTQRFHENGIKLCANIKPCLLSEHPLFHELEALSGFVTQAENEEPQLAQFWDGLGAYLDFTNPETIRWWKQQVTEKLLVYGIDSTWNDNNEFEIWDDSARCHGFGQEIPIGLLRPVQALLMMKASYEAQREFAPAQRPYLISRSGCPGMQRYVQTWSGDNSTSWNSLQYNIRMGKGLSLCGIFNFGHDVGGFSGKTPEPELFVRWVQNGIFHPRFTIHSWNDDGTANEPWMYPEVLPLVRELIEFRYRLLPYLYNLLYRASLYNEPIVRPTFYDFEADERTFEENDTFMLGASLLVASVVEEGQRERQVYLPKGPEGWYDFYSGEWFQSGQTIAVPAPLEICPLFVREGGVIPLRAQSGEGIEFRCYPPRKSGEASYELFEDDGESWDYLDDQYKLIRINLLADKQEIVLHLELEGLYQLPYHTISFRFPETEQRPVRIVHGSRVIQFDSLERMTFSLES